MKRLKLSHPTEKMLIFILVLIIGLMSAIIWVYGWRLNVLWEQSGNNLAPPTGHTAPMNTNSQFYIQSALKALYPLSAVTDPVQQRVYVPEARLYLPLNTLSRSLVYFSVPRNNNTPESLSVSSSFLINVLPSTWSDASCTQQHTDVTINKKTSLDPEETYAGSNKLNDGRILYFYEETAPSCNDSMWSALPASAAKITDLFKLAQSY